jgi:hypothetical protein
MKRYPYLLALLIFPTLLLAQQTPPPPAPDIAISLNGGSSNLYSGWPLIVHLTILNSNSSNPSGAGDPLVISPPNALWTDAIGLTVQSSSGASVPWPLKLVGTPSDTALTLATTEYVRTIWQMSSADVSALTPGDYTITASIGVSNSAGWNGSVQSVPVSLTVGPEPALTADLLSEKTFEASEFAVNTGDFFSAVTATQQLRLDQPDNPEAAAIAAGVLGLAGYGPLAFLESSDALDTFYRVNPTPQEAPFNLLTSYQQLLTVMATPDESVLPTSTLGSGASLTFSPNPQLLGLGATITSSTTVNGGTVAFTITGIAGSATSQPLIAGSASASFTVPGGTHAGSYPIVASYSGTPSFSPSSDQSAALTITPATPIITWNNPPDINLGVPLGAAQLNATANVPGVFVYSPPAGTHLSIGNAQPISVAFKPADAVDYLPASTTVAINVKSVPGDLNADGLVDCADLNIVKASFGKRAGQAGFDPRADVNGDGVVNVLDLSAVAKFIPAGTVCK